MPNDQLLYRQSYYITALKDVQTKWNAPFGFYASSLLKYGTINMDYHNRLYLFELIHSRLVTFPLIRTIETLMINDDLFPEYTVGITFADKYISELGNKLCELHPELDFVVLINISTLTVSYRTVKDDLDLSDIAKRFGGGGHPKASGSRFDASIVNDMLNNIFR